MSYHQHIRVDFRYDVHFARNVFTPRHTLLKRVLGGRGALFYIDRGVAKHHPHLKPFIEAHYGVGVHTVRGGETVKNDLSIIERVGGQIRRARLDRHASIVIIGGGAVLDAVGFAAAITHRGMRQVRIPTTVLSQNDSGIGVKNGVNAFGAKNFFGTFAPPAVVINDAAFLATLDDRDWIAGSAEAFKVGIIKDLPFLRWLDRRAADIQSRDPAVMESLVKRCAILHLDHIRQGGDPFETGSSRPLDFGHWSAHKLESLTRNHIRHGEAVAVGVALDMFIADQRGLIARGDVNFVLNAMRRAGLPVWHPRLEDPKIIDGIREFREHIGGELCLTMPNGLGRRVEIHELDAATVRRCVAKLKAWNVD